MTKTTRLLTVVALASGLLTAQGPLRGGRTHCDPLHLPRAAHSDYIQSVMECAMRKTIALLFVADNGRTGSNG